METRWVVTVSLGLAACGGGGSGSGPMPDASAEGGRASIDGGMDHATRDAAGPGDAAQGRDARGQADGIGSPESSTGHHDSGAMDTGSHTDAALAEGGNDAARGDGGSDSAASDGSAHHEDGGERDSGSRADSGHHVDGSASTDAGFICGFCNTPPAAVCSNTMTLEFYPSSGSCSGGVCTYTPSFSNCPNGCGNGTCNPSGWTQMNSSTIDALYAVWGSSASDVWAVGENGVAVHYDGNSWTVESPPGASYLASITGTGPNDVYTTDSSQSVWHFNGTGWALVSALAPSATFSLGLFAAEAGSLWVSGFQDVGGELINTASLTPSNGTTLGATESDGAGENFNGPSNSCAVIALSSTDIWIGSSPLSHSDGTTLTALTDSSGAVSFWAASPQVIFAGTGSNTVEIYNGMSWTPSNTGTSGQTGGIWGTSPSRVFVATWPGEGEGTVGEVRAYNGIGWSNETLPANTGLYAVYAAPTGEVFAVGEGGTILKGP